MAFNQQYYNNGIMRQLSPRADAFSTYFTSDNIVIGTFQGERGGRPDLDFKVRVLFDGEDKRPILPPHTYWVVDLMLKCADYGKEVGEIASYYRTFYNQCTPFATQTARHNYVLQTRPYITAKYKHIEHQGTLSLDYVATIVELFCLCEKQTAGAYMFRDLLKEIYDYAGGASNYIQLLEAAKPGNR